MKRDGKYWQAVAVMIGYIIGVGMFGLPIITAKSGLFLFFVYLISLGIAQYFIHLIYANMILATESYKRLPGYVGLYLGHKYKIAVFLAKIIGNYGALLAYIILSGIFLHQLLSPFFGGTPAFYSTAIYLLEVAVVFFGIGMIARFELFMSALLVIVVFLMAYRGWGVIEAGNFAFVDWHYALFPFGAMLMAMDGNGSIPIVAKILNKDRRRMKSVIRASMLISTLVTAGFVLTIVGISGAGTTEDALSGVRAVLDDGVVVLALVFGVFSMMTSVFGVAEAVKETYWWDFGVNKNLSWFMAVSVPLLMFFLGFNDLIEVISFAGAIAGGFCAIMLMMIFMKLKKQPEKLVVFKMQPPNCLIYLIIILFLIGMLYNIDKFLFP